MSESNNMDTSDNPNIHINQIADQDSYPDMTPDNIYNIDYEKLYKPQLDEMHQLGLFDREVNLECLKKVNGNVAQAASLIFDKMDIQKF